jgi:hypothetical protein
MHRSSQNPPTWPYGEACSLRSRAQAVVRTLGRVGWLPALVLLMLAASAGRPAPSRAQNVNFGATNEHHVGAVYLRFGRNNDPENVTTYAICKINWTNEVYATLDVNVDLARGTIDGTIKGDDKTVPDQMTLAYADFTPPDPNATRTTSCGLFPRGYMQMAEPPRCCRYSLDYTVHWSISGTLSGSFQPGGSQFQLTGTVTYQESVDISACRNSTSYSFDPNVDPRAVDPNCLKNPLFGNRQHSSDSFTRKLMLMGGYSNPGPPNIPGEPDYTPPSDYHSALVGTLIQLPDAVTYLQDDPNPGNWGARDLGTPSYVPGDPTWERYRRAVEGTH